MQAGVLCLRAARDRELARSVATFFTAACSLATPHEQAWASACFAPAADAWFAAVFAGVAGALPPRLCKVLATMLFDMLHGPLLAPAHRELCHAQLRKLTAAVQLVPTMGQQQVALVQSLLALGQKRRFEQTVRCSWACSATAKWRSVIWDYENTFVICKIDLLYM